MLIEIADHLRDYVYDVFVTRFDFWLVFGILDLAGVWWLIRRKRATPEVAEVEPC